MTGVSVQYIDGQRKVYLNTEGINENVETIVEILSNIQDLQNSGFSREELCDIRVDILRRLPDTIEAYMAKNTSISDDVWTLIWLVMRAIRLETDFYDDLPERWISESAGVLRRQDIFCRLSIQHVIGICKIYTKKVGRLHIVMSFAKDWIVKNPYHKTEELNKVLESIMA